MHPEQTDRQRRHGRHWVDWCDDGRRRYDARLSPALDLLPASLHAQAGESLAGALHTAADVGGPTGAQVAGIAREAFVSGMHLAAIIAGCVALLAAAIVYRMLPAGNPHARGAATLSRETPDVLAEH